MVRIRLPPAVSPVRTWLSGFANEAIKLKPEIASLGKFGAQSPYTNPAYMALRAKTLYVGLRRAGFPDE
jgi:hypothetical protein